MSIVSSVVQMDGKEALHSAVADLISKVDLSIANDLPVPATTEVVRQVGLMAVRIMRAQAVPASARVALLSRMLSAGLSPDARFGGAGINGFVPQPDGSGRSSIMMLCVRAKFPEGMRLLLERGADIVKAVEDHGTTVTGQAIVDEVPECIRVALEYGSLEKLIGKTCHARDGSQAPWMLLDLAAVIDDFTAIKLLLDAGLPRPGLLSRAVRECHDTPELIDVLVDYGCDVDEHHFDPATTAVKFGKLKMLQRLLERGADPFAKTPGGASLMQLAKKNPEIKELLRAWKTAHTIKIAISGAGDKSEEKKRFGMGPL